MTPSAPSPKSLPRIGKYVAKNVSMNIGLPTSERIRTMTCPMIRSLFSTAQKTPAGWLGTVVALSWTLIVRSKTRVPLNSLDVVTVDKIIRGRIATVPSCGHEAIDTLDVVCQGYDTAGEDQQKGYDA